MTLVEAYRTLGVDPATAERAAVTKRYRDLVKKLHPDVRPAGEHDRATADLQRVNEAFAAVRSSGFPAIAPPPPAAPPYGAPPPGAAYRPGGNGATQPPPPSGNGYYAPPPPGNGYYTPPPPGNGRYASPPGSGAYGWAGAGNVYGGGQPGYRPYGNPTGPPFGGPAAPGSPFAGAPRSTVAPGSFGLARSFVGIDRFMGRTGRFYFILFIVGVVHALSRWGGGAALLPMGLSLAMWGASRRARRNCWRIIQALWSTPNTTVVGNLNRELSTSASVACGTWFGAIALELFELASR